MKFTLAVAAVALVAAVAGGMLSTRGAAPARGPSRAEPVDAQWYSALPLDPDAATAALLARVPAEAARRGDALSQTYMVVLALRLALLVAAGGLLFFSGAVADLAALAGRLTRRLPVQDAIVGVTVMAIVFAFLLPLESYAGYVRFWRAGFVTASYLDWLRDFTLDWAITTSFTAVGLVAVMALVRARPRTWPGWASLVYLILAAIYTFIAPGYIDPLFNRLTPLADGPDKARILALAHANGVLADNVYVQDASRQSVLLNAHVSGIGSGARIVLDDNTIASTPRREVDMVMAHEIGHFVLAHDAKSVLAQTVVNAVGFLLIAWALAVLLERVRAALEDRGDLERGRRAAGVAPLHDLGLGCAADQQRDLARAGSRSGSLRVERLAGAVRTCRVHDARRGRVEPGPIAAHVLALLHPSESAKPHPHRDAMAGRATWPA